MNLIRGAIVVLVLAGGWYVAALIEGGPDFFRKQVLAENVLRFAGGSDFHEGHIHPFYYMELALFAGFMPWTLLLPIVGVRPRARRSTVDPRLKYIFVWFATVLIFYNLPQSKRGVYLLCLYPAFRDPARDLFETGNRAASDGAHLRPLDRAIVRFRDAAARQRRSGCARDARRMAARSSPIFCKRRTSAHQPSRHPGFDSGRALDALARDAAGGRRTGRAADRHPTAGRANGIRNRGRDGFRHRRGQRRRRAELSPTPSR